MRAYKSNHTFAKHLDPKCVEFSLFTAQDIEKLSVTKIRTPLSFNILGHPLPSGLYDPALGSTTEQSDPCATCGSNGMRCTGHFGHIELPVPVTNPIFYRDLMTILKMMCCKCFMIQIPIHIKLVLSAKLKLLKKGFLSDIDGLDSEVSSIITNDKEFQEGKLQYIRDIIETYEQNVINRSRFSTQSIIQSDDEDGYWNTKNANAQWQACIRKTLKQLVHTGQLCIFCSNPLKKFTVLKNKIFTTKVTDDRDHGTQIVHRLENVMVMPDQIKEYLRHVWVNEKDFLKTIFPCLKNIQDEYPTDVFFFHVVPILPPSSRPINRVNGQIIEHPQSQVYKMIAEHCLVLRNIIQTIQNGNTDSLTEEGKVVIEKTKGATPIEKLHNCWMDLQASVDHLMDRDLNKTPDSSMCQGLKQIIEKKEGIIRMHMMGKRVNFAARSVITPDPNLNIDEIGVPEAFALKLTYPTPVTPWNVVQLRQMILNGPNVHPGAVLIEYEDGSTSLISGKDIIQREAIAKRLLSRTEKAHKFFTGVKVVHRHLQNDDILLINRQPTLHKPSIMAHKARILKGDKTLRLHYANCKAYNADFDGDEMNAHFPQNELARSEGYSIANVSNQYLVPKDGTPLSGLIQDYMISGVRLTTRGKFFSHQDYMQLVYSALSMITGKVKLLPPTIIKPKPLWSGKQIISTIVINITPENRALINLTSSAKIPANQWKTQKPRRWKCGIEFTDTNTMSEAEVVIRNGELLCGVLDKTHYGATTYGLIHCFYELYGGNCSSKILSAFGKLFQTYLQWEGFTLGIQDILIVPEKDEERKDVITKCRLIGEAMQKTILEISDDTPKTVIEDKIEESYWNNPKFRTKVDRKYKSALDDYTNKINKICLPAGLLQKFPDNNLQMMVQSGAKGSMVNTMQISCLLGQIELEGKRPPLMISGKSLPSFPPYDPSPRAGGFIDQRFMTGIQPQEFYFHCMAGREGLIDTAVKTSRSGYLQRCLIKHLEGLVINYDSTVRDSDGSLIQTYYGEDGLDISGSRFLNKEQIQFLIDNKNAIVEESYTEYLKQDSDTNKINKLTKKIKKWTNQNGSAGQKIRVSDFATFSKQCAVADTVKNKTFDVSCGRTKAALSKMRKWIRADEELKKKIQSQSLRCPDPVSSKFRQDINYGVIPERLENLIDDYLRDQSRSDNYSRISKQELKDILCTKVMKAICPPGEPVGLLAAQSIGEPSTQMTLNTFHFAGRGEMNVTLGIPRLREILMMASKNIKTPSMEVPFKKNLPRFEKLSNRLRQKLTKCVLSDVLKNIEIERKMEHTPERRLIFTLKIEYLPYKSYKNEFFVKPQDVIKKTEELFMKSILKEIKKMSKLSGELLYFEEEKRKRNDDQNLDQDVSDVDEPTVKPNTKLDIGEMHESSDEDEIANDADATATRSVSRHQENREYDDPEEEEVENDNEDQTNNNSLLHGLIDPDDEDEEERNPGDVSNSKIDNLEYEERRAYVTNKYTNVLKYEYDFEKGLWANLTFWLPPQLTKLDLPTIIRKVASNIVLWETPCIKRAFTFQNPEGEVVLKTDGLNIVEMFKYDQLLNLQKLYSNDIHGISQTYGIEAANRVMIKEVRDVFKMYGITVDSRHLSLIADYMTLDGTFQPLNRTGIENCASPFQQISFERSLAFLRDATLQGKTEGLESPSSRLMIGQPSKSGTGLCSLLVKVEKRYNSTVPEST